MGLVPYACCAWLTLYSVSQFDNAMLTPSSTCQPAIQNWIAYVPLFRIRQLGMWRPAQASWILARWTGRPGWKLFVEQPQSRPPRPSPRIQKNAGGALAITVADLKTLNRCLSHLPSSLADMVDFQEATREVFRCKRSKMPVVHVPCAIQTIIPRACARTSAL
jgi:hypothetical protein